MTGERKVYLHEADEYVGPFHSLADATVFLIMMEWCGVSSAGIEIVEMEADATGPWQTVCAAPIDLERIGA